MPVSELRPVADDALRHWFVIRAAHPACPIFLAEKNALFTVECPEGCKFSAANIREAVKERRLSNGLSLARQKPRAKPKLIIRVHAEKSLRYFAVRVGWIRGKNFWSKIMKCLLQPLPVFGNRFGTMRRTSDKWACEDGQFLRITAHNHRNPGLLAFRKDAPWLIRQHPLVNIGIEVYLVVCCGLLQHLLRGNCAKLVESSRIVA